jgi:hypothetical protein
MDAGWEVIARRIIHLGDSSSSSEDHVQSQEHDVEIGSGSVVVCVSSSPLVRIPATSRSPSSTTGVPWLSGRFPDVVTDLAQ